MIKTINLNKLSNVKPLELLYGIRGTFNVVFDDGVVRIMDGHTICLSRYFWELCYKHNTPITSDLDIRNFYENGFFTSSTHKDFFSYWYKKYIKEFLIPKNILTFENMEASWITMVDIVNALYSELQYHILEYGVSLSMFDYIDLQKDTELLQAIDEAMKDKLNPKHIDKVTDIVKKVMIKNPNNNLSKLFNCGAANRTQITHGVGLRGFVTDINNMIYSELVGTNLTKRLEGFYAVAAESAVMAKALKLQEFGVRYSEWLQRELHLVSMNLMTLELEDCGNRYYHEWFIKDKNDLALVEGSNALIDGKEVEIDVSLHQHIIGNIIKIRRINDCNSLKRGKVCMKCLGSVSYTIPKHASVAHTLITVLMAMIGQLMLSAKHYTESTALKILKLSNVASRYLRLQDSDHYMRTDLDKNRKYSIILSNDSYYGFRLLSSSMTSKIDTLDTAKLSTIDSMFIKVANRDNENEFIKDFIEIRQDGRSGILDQDFIIHSLNNTTITSNGDYEIDMTNYTGRVLYLENKEFAFDQFNADFKKMLLSYGGRKRIVPEVAVQEIFTYLNKKLSINIKIVEILVAALTIESKKDYSPGLNRETREVSSYRDVILNRSVGISLGFMEQKNILNTAANYTNKISPYNPLENVWNMKNIVFKEKK